MNTAIIVAAGTGSRLNPDKPKQFLEIHGRAIVLHTLDRFQECSSIDEIILVLPEAVIADFEATLDDGKPVKLAAGGLSRVESVYNGIKLLDPDTEIVAVHDGARPFVTSGEIDRTVEKAREIGAACLVAAVTDTIKEIDGNRIIGTIDRAKLRRALTPQAFKREILDKAFAQADLSESITDECVLVEKLGYEIGIVEGSARNIKITHPEDLILAEQFLKL
jgi:2-C-methyl-D-erythritol 4-phosphate cytidylyltransferase